MGRLVWEAERKGRIQAEGINSLWGEDQHKVFGRLYVVWYNWNVLHMYWLQRNPRTVMEPPAKELWATENLKEQKQWILTLAAVWQMELRKMRVGHFRSYWNSPGKNWWDTDLSTGRDDGEKKKKKFEIYLEIKQTGLNLLLSHSVRSYSGSTDQ